MRIFIIGPGGVGKSTSGKILANLVDYNFIDLDEEFYNNIGNIGDFIKKFGYESYCFKNSKLFYNILNNSSKDCVISLSSGFLVHENLNELTENHKKTLNEQGVILTLLPSKSIEESTNIVVKRQLLRGFGLNEEREKNKFIKRYTIYEKLGDIQIFSYEKPEVIAKQMQEEIDFFTRNLNKKKFTSRNTCYQNISIDHEVR